MDPEAIGWDYAEFPKGLGNLRLKCGQAAFVRLRDLVCAEARITEIDTSKIRFLTIDDYHPDTPPRKTQLREIVGGVGCGLICGSLLFLVCIGIHTVWRWVVGP